MMDGLWVQTELINYLLRGAESPSGRIDLWDGLTQLKLLLSLTCSKEFACFLRKDPHRWVLVPDDQKKENAK